MQSIAPERTERRGIKRAFRAAGIWRWTGAILVRAALILAIIVGVASRWYYGVAVFAVAYSGLLLAERLARCPRCHTVWTSKELDSLVCGTCRLDIRLGLRDENAA